MARALVLPDVHERVDLAEQLLSRVSHDEAYCVGDWFDNWGSKPEAAKRTAEWLKSHRDSLKSVFGNHDVPYAYSHLNPDIFCPGFTRERGATVRQILNPSFWDGFTLHAWVDGWLISHAGVHPFLLQQTESEQYREVIDYCCEEALRSLRRGNRHFLCGWGEDRGGIEQRLGGITWMDWSSFQPVPGLNQLVGHTFDKVLKTKRGPDSDNVCIDTAFRHFAIIENGTLSLYEVSTWLKSQ